jgi:hypothetical protein
LCALAVELARREELEVAAVAYEDESLELEVVLAGDRFREPVTIDRDGTGRRCQMSWQGWADIGDDTAMERPPRYRGRHRKLRCQQIAALTRRYGGCWSPRGAVTVSAGWQLSQRG